MRAHDPQNSSLISGNKVALPAAMLVSMPNLNEFTYINILDQWPIAVAGGDIIVSMFLYGKCGDWSAWRLLHRVLVLHKTRRSNAYPPLPKLVDVQGSGAQELIMEKNKQCRRSVPVTIKKLARRLRVPIYFGERRLKWSQYAPSFKECIQQHNKIKPIFWTKKRILIYII